MKFADGWTLNWRHKLNTVLWKLLPAKAKDLRRMSKRETGNINTTTSFRSVLQKSVGFENFNKLFIEYSSVPFGFNPYALKRTG